MSNDLEPGDFILITGGTFERFTATVTGVDKSTDTVLAEIDVFGKKTPVEIEETSAP
jgi:transcription antitermination factor NusG